MHSTVEDISKGLRNLYFWLPTMIVQGRGNAQYRRGYHLEHFPNSFNQHAIFLFRTIHFLFTRDYLGWGEYYE